MEEWDGRDREEGVQITITHFKNGVNDRRDFKCKPMIIIMNTIGCYATCGMPLT